MVRTKNNNRMYWMVAASLAGFGCAGSQGTEPHDMSAAQHEKAAGAEDVAASQHDAQYDPQATAEQKRCAKAVCWTSETNPTEEHKADVERHQKLAAEHRAAAQALRDAEAQACAGIPEEDRDTSPFYHREDITSVSEIKSTTARGKAQVESAVGARAVFRAVPGLTAEWLQREVDCHLARAAAVGNNMPEMDYCPLVLKGVNAKVSSTGDGFAIDVTSADATVAKEAERRMVAAKQ
jgi:hypothetical protein